MHAHTNAPTTCQHEIRNITFPKLCLSDITCKNSVTIV